VTLPCRFSDLDSRPRSEFSSAPAAMTQASPFDPSAMASRFIEAAPAAGFRTESFGTIEGHALFALTRRTPGRLPRIYLSAGIHGDEPAPPHALLELLTTGCFDHRATWFLCPLLNPTGLALGTRENASKVDLNRDYRDPVTEEIQSHLAWLQRQPPFDLVLLLHEDWETWGYYLFEHNVERRPSFAQIILDAAVAAGCPRQPGSRIDGFDAKDGVISGEPYPETWTKWPEAFHLRTSHARLLYTVESPSALPMEIRVAAHCSAVRAAIDAFVG